MVTYPSDGDNSEKSVLIADGLIPLIGISKTPVLREGPMVYQLVGSVKDYQGYDG